MVDEDNGVELFHLRPRDIAVYVGSGTVDVGITGQDMLLDSRTPAEEILPLGFGKLDLPLRGAHRHPQRCLRAAGRPYRHQLREPRRGLPHPARHHR